MIPLIGGRRGKSNKKHQKGGCLQKNEREISDFGKVERTAEK